MIYADYNGSAPVCQEVVDYLTERLKTGPYANPNSIHCLGTKVMGAITKARKTCADLLGANMRQVIFNSGSSEGLSHAFFNILDTNDPAVRNVIISTPIEHSAVVEACKHYQKQGYVVHLAEVNSDGEIIIASIEKLLAENSGRVTLVTAMAANNETGVIQNFKAISQLCQKHNVPYICDTTQIIGKMEFNFSESGIDYAVLSGHKLGSITGVGLILAKNPEKLGPHIFGGHQEMGKRAGTQNYLGIETLALALKSSIQKLAYAKETAQARLHFEAQIKKEFPEVVIIGEKANRLPTTTLISYPGLHGQAVQIELESQNIFVTTSSACSDNEPETSKVLKGMGIQDNVGRGVVRISIGYGNKGAEYTEILNGLTMAYNKLSKIKGFTK